MVSGLAELSALSQVSKSSPMDGERSDFSPYAERPVQTNPRCQSIDLSGVINASSTKMICTIWFAELIVGRVAGTAKKFSDPQISLQQDSID